MNRSLYALGIVVYFVAATLLFAGETISVWLFLLALVVPFVLLFGRSFVLWGLGSMFAPFRTSPEDD
jgi:hypothetical protein